jgi:hypothetical protein
MGKAGAIKAENVFALSTMIGNIEALFLDAAGISRQEGAGRTSPRPAVAGWRLLYHWLL